MEIRVIPYNYVKWYNDILYGITFVFLVIPYSYKLAQCKWYKITNYIV